MTSLNSQCQHRKKSRWLPDPTANAQWQWLEANRCNSITAASGSGTSHFDEVVIAWWFMCVFVVNLGLGSWSVITTVYRCHGTSNFSFLSFYCVIYLLPNQKVKIKRAVSPVLHKISKQLQGSPLHSRLRAIGGDPFRLFGVVNFASHFICFQISALPLILSASKNPTYNFRGYNR